MKKIISLLLLLIFIGSAAHAQYVDTLVEYYDYYWKKIDPQKDVMFYFRVAKKTETGYWQTKDYYAANKAIKIIATYSDDSMITPEGEYVGYYDNGNIETIGKYYHGTKVGLWRSYYYDGSRKDSSYFKLSGMPYHKAYEWDASGKLIYYVEYDMDGSGEGYLTEYFQDSTIAGLGKYAEGNMKDSTWVYYREDGSISAKEYYDKGRWIKCECYTIDGEQYRKGCDTIYSEPKVGFDIHKYKLEVPAEVSMARYGDGVLLWILTDIDREGKIYNPRVIKGAVKELNIESIKVINKYPNLLPARQYGRPVNGYFIFSHYYIL